MNIHARIPSPDVRSIQLEPILLHFYALFILAAIAAALILTSRRLTHRGGGPGIVLDFTLWAVPFGVISGRLHHGATHPTDYLCPGANLWTTRIRGAGLRRLDPGSPFTLSMRRLMPDTDHNTKPVINDVARLAGVAVATVSRVVNGSARVSTSAAEELVTYLLNLGHSQVHYVNAPPQQEEDDRGAGWRRALRTAGVVPPEVIHASVDPHSGREIGRLLAKIGEITAIFCGNDVLAIGVISGLADGGKSVPVGVSVVGVNDHPLAKIWLPKLTTVNQSFANLGSRARELLHGLIDGGSVQAVTPAVQPNVVIQDSAAASRSRRRP